MNVRRSLIGLMLLLGAVDTAWGQAPVGPVPPQVRSADSLQALLTEASTSPLDLAWTRMDPAERAETVAQLRRLVEQVQTQSGYPVGPVAPAPAVPVTPAPTPPTPPTPSVSPAPGTKAEYDALLETLARGLDVLGRQQPRRELTGGETLYQLLARLKTRGAP